MKFSANASAFENEPFWRNQKIKTSQIESVSHFGLCATAFLPPKKPRVLGDAGKEKHEKHTRPLSKRLHPAKHP